MLLSKDLDHYVLSQLQDLNLKLKNPWLQLVANVITYRDIPHGSCLDIRLFPDRTVHNMFAAFSLLQYADEDGDCYAAGESLFLPSFLESKEPVICIASLYSYMEMVYSKPPPQTFYLSGAVHVVFNPTLPNHHLDKGWYILFGFADWFEYLSLEWRRTFAEAFFTLSRRPLLTGNGQNSTPTDEDELREILTWDYFCKEEQEPELTDAEFCGLDWMAMAWSLHISQPPGTSVTVSEPMELRPPSSEERSLAGPFVLEVLSNLIDAAPFNSIVPIIPKLREFVEWFDDPELLEYHGMISTRIVGVIDRHQECKMFYKFQNFYCMWPL